MPKAILSLAAFFSLFLLGFTSAHAAGGCLQRSSPDVRVVPVYSAPVFDDRRPLRDLQNVYNTENGAHVNGLTHGHLPLGLTTAKLMGRLRQDMTLQIGAGRSVCGYLNSLEVEIGFSDTVVMIARDLPRRSCSYNEVLKHEMKHVNADREYLRAATPRINAYWKEVAANVKSVSGGGREQVERQITEYLNQALEKLLADLNKERSAIQAQIDTHEEYERVSYSCNGQIFDILKQRYGQTWLDDMARRQQLTSRQ